MEGTRCACKRGKNQGGGQQDDRTTAEGPSAWHQGRWRWAHHYHVRCELALPLAGRYDVRIIMTLSGGLSPASRRVGEVVWEKTRSYVRTVEFLNIVVIEGSLLDRISNTNWNIWLRRSTAHHNVRDATSAVLGRYSRALD